MTSKISLSLTPGFSRVPRPRARAKTVSTVFTLCALGLLLGVSPSFAGSPTFVNKTATGTTSAEVIFPADPALQIRVVTAFATSDKAASVLSFTSGAGAYVISAANVAGTTITVSQTNGLAPSDVLIISAANGSTNYARTISSFANSTNIVLTASTQNATAVGDSVYKMSAATTIKVAAASVTYNGDAIYVGASQGRPVRCVLDGTSACSIDSMSARYE